MTSFNPYKSYNFKDKDPIIDRMRTIVQDSRLSYKEIREITGVSTGCLRGWFDGATRRPTFAALAAVARGLGYDFYLRRPETRKVMAASKKT